MSRRAFDVAVIGGGVVGCAVARRFALEGARVVLLEAGTDILSGASKANSALLHTGFDAPTGSLELACMQAGYAEYLEIKDRFNLPLLETGAMVVAWSEDQLAKLPAIQAQAVANGVFDTVLLDRAETLAREPALAPSVLGALLVPGEHVIDPWSAPLAYITQAMAHGAEVVRSAAVTGGAHESGVWRLDTTHGRFEAATVVNCAGLHGDTVDRLVRGSADFTIKPRKGQFVVFDKIASALFHCILLPVPTEITKGVVLARTIFGNVLVGPTAEEQEDRTRATVVQESLEALHAIAVRLMPGLADVPVTAIYAGLRPATERKEYRVSHDAERHWITLGGIRSTGLTAALGLAQHAVSLWQGVRSPVTAPEWPAMPMLAEHGARDWQTPGYGEIVCHCELVTRREIEAALASPLPPGDLSGLKRRTRATMGRCQGFYCGARVAALTEGRFS